MITVLLHVYSCLSGVSIIRVLQGLIFVYVPSGLSVRCARETVAGAIARQVVVCSTSIIARSVVCLYR